MSVGIVKSVRRVFEILELFESERVSMNVAHVAKQLNYPHSSTLSILKSMEVLGYMANTNKFNYFPTNKLLSLTSWLSESLEDEVEIIKFMTELHQETGETINLSKQSGDYVKIMHGLLGFHAITINVREGTLMPANSSFTGISLLATLPDMEINDILVGLNEQNISSGFSIEEVKEMIENVRKNMVSAGYDLFVKGIGAITAPIRSTISGETFIIGLVGPTGRLRENEGEYKSLFQSLLNKHKLEAIEMKSK